MKSLTRGHFKAGIDSLRGSKMRNFWTVLGVVIGVASVITVVAIGEGIKQQVSGQINRQGKDLIVIRPAQINSGNGSLRLLPGSGLTGALSPADAAAVAEAPEVAVSAPLAGISGTLKSEAGSYQGVAVATGPNLPNLLNQTLAYGDFFSADDGTNEMAVIGKETAMELFNEAVPLGRTISFQGRDYIVRGIFNEFPSSMTGDVDYNRAIFIPYDLAQDEFKNSAATYEILARAKSGVAPTAAAVAVKKRILQNHGGQQNFEVLGQDANLQSSSTILDLLTRLITGVAAISLLVGGIGIMNVMLVSVTERMHEIGIRKAIGATNRQILSQFLIESTVLSLLGGVIGIALSVAVTRLLAVFTDLRPVISWQIVAIATGVSLLVGIIFGCVPALKAARRDPIEALRSNL